MSYESTVTSLAPVGRWKLDETSGNAIDSIGGNDGTVGAGITQGGEAAIAGGASYEGDGTSISSVKADTGIAAYPYSMAVWFKTTAVSDTILSLGSKSVAEYTDIRLTGTGQVNLRSLDSGGGANVNANNAASGNDGEWHLVVVAIESDTSKTIYYDAEDGAELTANRAFPTGDVEFVIMGRPSGTSASALDGHTSEALLFDKALTATEVQSLYLAGRPPVLRYKLELSASAADSALTDYATRVGTASITTAQNTAIMSTDTGNGADVWFSSDEAGTLPIDAKLVYWDDATSKFAFDVEITSVSAVSGATIYLQVGSKPGGYGTDPYKATVDAVAPLASDFDDLTSNGNDGSGFGGITAGGVTGPDGHTPATDFDGAGDYLAFASLAPTYDTSTWSMSLWVDPDAYNTAYALRIVGDNSKSIRPNHTTGGVFFSDGKHGVSINDGGGDRSGDGWYHVAVTYDGPDFKLYVNGAEEESDSAAHIATTYSNLTLSNVSDDFDGGMAGFRADSEARTAAEINADYLLQGSTASSYWTVTDVTPGLPEATFDLRSDRDVVLSGSDVTSWGNASGGTSPTYSDDPADKVLGFPAIQFDASSSQYLEWDEIASMFSGDEPDFTAAILCRVTDVAALAIMLSAGNSSNGEFRAGVTGSSFFGSIRDDSNNNDSGGGVPLDFDAPLLILFSCKDGELQTLVRNVSTGAENTLANTVDVDSRTLVYGAIGTQIRGGTPSAYCEGSIHRIRLYNTALGGDLTGDLTGTQLGQLKDEMLLQAGGTFNLSSGLSWAPAHDLCAALDGLPLLELT